MYSRYKTIFKLKKSQKEVLILSTSCKLLILFLIEFAKPNPLVIKLLWLHQVHLDYLITKFQSKSSVRQVNNHCSCNVCDGSPQCSKMSVQWFSLEKKYVKGLCS